MKRIGIAACALWLAITVAWWRYEVEQCRAIELELNSVRSGLIVPVLRQGSLPPCNVEDESQGFCSRTSTHTAVSDPDGAAARGIDP